jgi:phosphopantothenoylcysteine decarboxylase/phosphopantothenate--cysteine ligase
MGVSFVEPKVSEGKAKLPSRLMIVEQVIRTLAKYGQDGIAEKRVLIIGGSTAQPLDAMRVLTNRSSGRTAITLANEAYRKGAEIQLWYGWSHTSVPEWIENVQPFTTVEDLLELVENSELDFDIIILCAAISDYTPDSYQGKIGSGFEELTIELHPTPKVIEVIREKARDAFLIGFKAESDVEEEELLMRAEERMNQVGCDLMVANLLEDVGEEDTRVFILVKEEGVEEVTGSKEKVASSLFEIIGNRIGGE